jgi:alpha-mannosidase
MKDYEDVRKVVNKFIKQGDKYFNSLNFTRNAVTFVEKEDGRILRCGKTGEFVKPNLAPFTTSKEITSFNHGIKEQWLSQNKFDVETPYYKISFAEDGSIVSLVDKELDREWVDTVFNKLHIYQDLPGMYDAWDILPNYKDKELDIHVDTALHLAFVYENCATFEVSLSTKASKWKMQIRLFADSRDIEVEHIVDWQEKHQLAKMEFGMNVVSRELVCDTSAGYIRRDTHKNTTWQQARFEVCMHKWCDMSETDGGVAIINDGKYGVGVDENKITISLLRATIRPDITSDMGQHNFCYKIVPHAGNHIQAEINNLAYEYNVPLLKVNVPDIENTVLRHVLNRISGKKSLYLQAVKISEDKKRIIVRVTEQDGTRGKLVFDHNVQLVNLLEDVQDVKTKIIQYKPFEIITFAINLDDIN